LVSKRDLEIEGFELWGGEGHLAVILGRGKCHWHTFELPGNIKAGGEIYGIYG
jgi:hypothetical protein